MKHVFAGIFVFLLTLSVVVWILKPRADYAGKTELVWVSDDNPGRRVQIALFNELHPDYHLRLDPASSGMAKLIVQSIAGVGPDLFDCHSGFELSAFVTAGIAWDLTDAMAAEDINVKNDTWAATHTTCLYEGRVYGFPRNAGADAVFYNKNLFKAAGVELPPRFIRNEEFLRLAKVLTITDGNGRVQQYGFLFSWGQYPHFLRQWDAHIYSESGTVCVLDRPEAIAAIQYMHDLIWKHRVSPTPQQEAAMATAGGWGSGAITLFGGGRAAMALGGRWWLCTLRNKSSFPNLELGVTECQFGPVRQYHGYCGVVMINRNSPKRQDAIAFLKYMASGPYNNLINHQADALCPVKKYAETDEFLHDPVFPEETYNDVWREVLKHSVPGEVSPFINGNTASRIITEQLDLIKTNLKSPSDGLRTATQQIDREIQRTLERDPVLREKYDKLIAKEGAP